MEGNSLKTIVFVVSELMTVDAFLLPHIRALSAKYQIHIVANARHSDALKETGIDAQVFYAPITRSIAPIADIRAIFYLILLLRRLEADMVISITPKAGLLSMLAACFKHTPHRIHIFTGQVWKTMTGFGRLFFKFLDKVLFYCTTYALVDSPSQRQFLLEQGIIKSQSCGVLCEGSVCGVDTERFSSNSEVRKKIRNQYSYVNGDVVFLFLGRLKKDKGILDLVNAFKGLVHSCPGARLLIVGPDEEDLLPDIKGIMGDDKSAFSYVEYTNTPEIYMSAADVFCLPSYREGFGSVIIEAAASGLPAIGTDIYGIQDAIKNEESGLIYPVGNVDELAACMMKLYESKDLRNTLGLYARQRVCQEFSEEKLTSALVSFVDEKFKSCERSALNQV